MCSPTFLYFLFAALRGRSRCDRPAGAAAVHLRSRWRWRGVSRPPPPLSESTPDHTRRSDGGGCESCTAGEFCATSSGRARCVPLDCANVLQHSCMLPSVPSCSAWESPPNETNAVDAPRQCTLTSCEDSATGAYCVESPRVDGLIHGWAPASIAASCIGGRFEFK